jgi:prevent-host-death family protein
MCKGYGYGSVHRSLAIANDTLFAGMGNLKEEARHECNKSHDNDIVKAAQKYYRKTRTLHHTHFTKINIDVNIDIKEFNMSNIKSIGMAEARPKLTQLVEEVYAGEDPYLIVSGSKIKAVLIGIDRYNDMVERLEDISDAAELLYAESSHEPTMSFEAHISKSKGMKSGVSA